MYEHIKARKESDEITVGSPIAQAEASMKISDSSGEEFEDAVEDEVDRN